MYPEKLASVRLTFTLQCTYVPEAILGLVDVRRVSGTGLAARSEFEAESARSATGATKFPVATCFSSDTATYTSVDRCTPSSTLPWAAVLTSPLNSKQLLLFLAQNSPCPLHFDSLL